MKILVTGACGFIGSHLVEDLVRAGYSVKAFPQYHSLGTWGWLDSLDQEILNALEVVPGDIRDAVAVKQAMESCASVLHLAALIAIPYSYVATRSYVDTNVVGTLNVMQAAKELAVEKIVHTSTSEVYGTARFVPITEEHPLRGQSPYAASKIAADQMALSYYYSYGTPVTVLRPFNTYGPRQSARAVIPAVIAQVAAGAREIKLGSLHPTRDFNYVKDTSRAFLAALKQDAPGETVNIGSNYEISIEDTVETILQLMHSDAKITCDSQRVRPSSSEVERLYSCNKKAKQLLGWEPQFAGVEGFKRGLVETIEWFSIDQHRASYKSSRYNI